MSVFVVSMEEPEFRGLWQLRLAVDSLEAAKSWIPDSASWSQTLGSRTSTWTSQILADGCRYRISSIPYVPSPPTS